MARQPDPTALLDHLQDFIAEIHWRMDICLAMFGGKSGDSVAELNKRTGRVFGCFQTVLLDSILLEIAKLFDPKEMGRPENRKYPVSLYRALADLSLPRARLQELKRDVKKLNKLCMPIIRRRHGKIAHNDQTVAAGAVRLPAITVRHMLEAIGGVSGFFDKMSMAHDGIQRVPAPDTYQERSQAETLIRFVREGNAAMDSDRARRFGPAAGNV